MVQTIAGSLLSAVHLLALAYILGTGPEPAAYDIISEAALAGTWIAITVRTHFNVSLLDDV